jgi:hypothetical protein
VEAQLVIVLEAQTFPTSSNMIRTATLALPRDLRRNCRFAPMFEQHASVEAMEASMDWRRFHEVVLAEQDGMHSSDALRRLSFGQGQQPPQESSKACNGYT